MLFHEMGNNIPDAYFLVFGLPDVGTIMSRQLRQTHGSIIESLAPPQFLVGMCHNLFLQKMFVRI